MRSPRAAVVVALTLVFAGTVASSAAAAPLFGFNDNAVVWKQLTASDDARIARQAGATTSRVTVDWGYVQPSSAHWIWSQYDAIYNADVAAGIRPIFDLAYAPAWARAQGTNCTQTCLYPPGPEHLAEWGTFVAAVAKRYPQLAAIEIWNEPNAKRYWASGVDPAYYTTVVRTAHDAVKAAGSSIPVLAGAISDDPLYDTADAMTPWTFLRLMYAAGFKGASDGISLHPYPSDLDEWRFFKTLADVREVRDANGDYDLPLWATEIGSSTSGTTTSSLGDYGQAVLVPRLYGLLSAMPDVKGVVVHSLLDPNQYHQTSFESGFGMINANLTLKPAYCAWALMNATGFICPTSVTQPAANPVQERRWEAQELVQRAADAARAYRRASGSYAGVTSAALHDLDPAISATPALGKQLPGPTADPSKVAIVTWTVGSLRAMVVCNSSRSDLTYCIRNAEGGRWVYGASIGTIGATAAAINQGKTASW